MTTVADVCKALQLAALAYPNQRVGQLIFNAMDARDLARNVNGTTVDVFYVPNETLYKALTEYAFEGEQLKGK